MNVRREALIPTSALSRVDLPGWLKVSSSQEAQLLGREAGCCAFESVSVEVPTHREAMLSTAGVNGSSSQHLPSCKEHNTERRTLSLRSFNEIKLASFKLQSRENQLRGHRKKCLFAHKRGWVKLLDFSIFFSCKMNLRFLRDYFEKNFLLQAKELVELLYKNIIRHFSITSTGIHLHLREN